MLKTTTSQNAPLDGRVVDPAGKPEVSDFLTVQSLTNFSALTGGIAAAWGSLQALDGRLASLWVPYLLSAIFGIISVIISWEGLKEDNKFNLGQTLGAIFIAFLNALVVASAVVGAGTATGLSGQ